MDGTKGVKFDADKAALDLIPLEALIGLGNVLTFGAKKYQRANWANGIEYSRLISAAMRHITAFNAGQDVDPESGLSHIDHALCNLAFLAWMRVHRTDLDNRWIKAVKQADAIDQSVARLKDIKERAEAIKYTKHPAQDAIAEGLRVQYDSYTQGRRK